MLSKNILVAALATTALAIDLTPRQEGGNDGEVVLSSTISSAASSDAAATSDAGSATITSAPSTQPTAPMSSGTTLSTGTLPQTSTCGAVISSYRAAVPQPTGALASELNKIATATNLCSAIKAFPSSLTKDLDAYESNLNKYLEQPTNVEGALKYVACLTQGVPDPSLVAEAQFLEKAAKELPKCKNAAAGTRGSMFAVAGVAGLAAVLCAIGMM
ncbi:hypothetical protein QBC35DRAFT_180051 [Podospora australis]|uniref:Uncharacterized protein n=1 Tax=Podospora australis TaxID=1536484 RepID=A0AAN6WWF4_9PEZI|nr:hypothetical protein QBC35DRAFT_180051 [Podospora australis]